MRLSVILPFRNAAATIEAAVRSILAQSEGDFELLAIDDGSTDASRERLLSAAAGDPRLRLLEASAAAGLAARLNQGIEASRGAWMARMDADDVAHPARFRLQLEAFEADPALDLVGGSVVVLDGDTPLGIRRFPVDHDQIVAQRWRGLPIAHPTFMARSEWMRAHRYDERFERAQDQELLLRAAPSSRFANLACPVVGYREPAAGASRDATRAFRRLAVRRHVGTLAALRLAARDFVARRTPPDAPRAARGLEPLAPAEAAAWRTLARTGRWPDPDSAS